MTGKSDVIDTTTDEGRELLRAENEAASSDILDNTGEQGNDDLGGDQQQQQQPRDDEPNNEPIRMSPADEARAKIAKKFKRADQVPFNGDANDPEMLYGDVARRTEEVDPDLDPNNVSGEQRPAPAVTQQQPRMITRKVRGQDITLSEDDWLERAAKVTAADSYLEESRALLEEAKTIKAERAGRDRRHPDGQSSTQDDMLLDPPEDDAQHPEHPKLVETLLYGDPEVAEAELDRRIDERADKKAEERQLARLMNNDLAKSQKALKDFVAANPDLSADKMAARAIESTLYDIYAEDIAKLGVVDADKIPKDGKTLADWHRFYRVHGHEVRDAASALNEAKERVVKWRGPTNQQQPARKDPARVHVNVDRTERRAAIPNQPSRATAPRSSTTQAPAKTPASTVIQRMRQARGQPVA